MTETKPSTGVININVSEVLANIYADLDKTRAESEEKLMKARRIRAEEARFEHEARLTEQEEIFRGILDDLRLEKPQNLVQPIFTEQGVFLTVPDVASKLNGRFQGEWQAIVLDYFCGTNDEVIRQDPNHLAFANAASYHLKLTIQDLGKEGLGISLVDLDEFYPERRIRLNGRLINNPFNDEGGRLVYVRDESSFTHPSIIACEEHSLQQAWDVIQFGMPEYIR